MLYAFFGTDVVEVRQKAHEFVVKKEAGGTTVERITPENFEPGVITDAAGSISLFAGPQLYVVDTPSGNSDMFDHVFNTLDMLAGSDNTFVLIEEKLGAKEKAAVKKHAEEFTEVTGKTAERFNVFALTDALMRKDKKSLWILLARARREGLSPEEIIGTLFWQINTLGLVARTSSAEEAGQKPFVYSKAQRALAGFAPGEVDRLSRELVSLYHEGHAGIRDIDIALERWVLTL